MFDGFHFETLDIRYRNTNQRQELVIMNCLRHWVACFSYQTVHWRIESAGGSDKWIANRVDQTV